MMPASVPDNPPEPPGLVDQYRPPATIFDEMRAAVQQAHMHHLKAAAHAESLQAIMDAMRAAGTWMAAQAKVAVGYDRPIWREAGHSGNAFVTHEQAVIGEIFDKVYSLGGLTNPPMEGIQTVTVAPGGAVITEFKLHVPGNYTIVERGLAGLLIVEGAPNPDIYNGTVMSGMGH